MRTPAALDRHGNRPLQFDLCFRLLEKLANASQADRERLSHFFLERFSGNPEQFAKFLRQVEARLRSKRGKVFAKQYLAVLSSIAEHFGMFKLKRHLDTACFSIAHPKEFAEVKRYLARYERDSSSKLKSIAKVLRDSLQPTPCVIRGRFKEPYSVYKKFREKAYRSLASIHDLFAFRIILGSQNEKDCFDALHILHDKFMPMAGRFKDYVSIPKTNGYQSLHTTLRNVLPDLDIPVELQIRTQFMHDFAQSGLSSHWLYKKKSGPALSREQRALLEHVSSLSRFAGRQLHVYVFAEGHFLRLPIGTTVRQVARAFGRSELDGTMPHLGGRRCEWDGQLKDGDEIAFLRRAQRHAKVPTQTA